MRMLVLIGAWPSWAGQGGDDRIHQGVQLARSVGRYRAFMVIDPPKQGTQGHQVFEEALDET